MKPAKPWAVCPNNSDSLSWIRIPLDPKSSSAELDSVGDLRSDLGVVDVLPSNIHSFLKENGEHASKLLSFRALTFVESENGDVNKKLTSGDTGKFSGKRISTAKLTPVLDVMFPKRMRKSNA